MSVVWRNAIWEGTDGIFFDLMLWNVHDMEAGAIMARDGACRQKITQAFQKFWTIQMEFQQAFHSSFTPEQEFKLRS